VKAKRRECILLFTYGGNCWCAAANGLITHLSDGLCFLYAVYVADRDVTLGDNKLRDINNPVRWPAFDDAHCAHTHTGEFVRAQRERDLKK
jgi:hypothetical protein